MRSVYVCVLLRYVYGILFLAEGDVCRGLYALCDVCDKQCVDVVDLSADLCRGEDVWVCV